MAASLTCQFVADEDLIARFVRGSLAPPEAERLEAHCFSCDACWAELQTAMALRASLEADRDVAVEVHDQAASAPTHAAALQHQRRRWVGWLAAAAVVVIVATVGSEWLRRQPTPAAVSVAPAAAAEPVTPSPAVPTKEPAPIERSAGAGLITISVQTRADASIQVAWPSVTGAISWRVALFAADGRELFSRDTEGRSLIIVRKDLDAVAPRSDVVVQVEARDVMGTIIARSSPVKLHVER